MASVAAEPRTRRGPQVRSNVPAGGAGFADELWIDQNMIQKKENGEAQVRCPRCGYPDWIPDRLFGDGGDDDMKDACNRCGKVYTIQKRIIKVEYSVKEGS